MTPNRTLAGIIETQVVPQVHKDPVALGLYRRNTNVVTVGKVSIALAALRFVSDTWLVTVLA